MKELTRGRIFKRGVSSSSSYGEKFTDLLLADWINQTNTVELRFADWATLDIFLICDR
jgi:hypothetical protein